MYQGLLLSAGGGILSPVWQAEQNECATIVIGLGGTGVECLRMLKREVYGRIRPDDPKAEVPSYQHIRFLGVDSDPSSIGKREEANALDWNTEFLNIGGPDSTALWANLPVIRQLPFMQWLSPEPLRPMSPVGAGGVRQMGRLLLFQRCPQFIQKLASLITSARAGLAPTAELSIHIFTGLGGGTGSGIFLDVCYLVQYVLSNLGLQYTAQTCGYFFLPDVNLARVADPGIQNFIKSNGFAAMQELDCCMDFANNGGAWDQDYSKEAKIHTRKPPVDNAWLISACDTENAVFADPYRSALSTVVQKVIEGLAASSTSLVPSGKYGILGVCSAVLPFREITTYMAANLFESFGYLESHVPAEKDVEEWILGQRLDYKSLLGDLQRDVHPLPPVDDAMVTKFLQVVPREISDDFPPFLREFYNHTLAEREKQLHINFTALLAETGEASLIQRVQKSLIEIAGDVEKGPRYAAAMLHSLDGKDLSFWLDGCVTGNGKYLAMARADMDLWEKNLRETLERFQGANILNRRKRAQEYLEALQRCFMGPFHIQEYEMMDQLLQNLKRRFSQLHSQIFKPMTDAMKELWDTFRENSRYLHNSQYLHIMRVRLPGNEMPILTVQDLRDVLDQRVQAVSLPSLFRGLVEALFQEPGDWESEGSFDHLVLSYFLEKMPVFPGDTLDDYIPTAQYGQLLAGLRRRSAPLFWRNRNQALAHAPANQIQVLRVPDNCPNGRAEADSYAMAQPGVFRQSSGEKDRLTCMSYWRDIPLSYYGGLDDCRRAYEALAKYPGVHLYEGTEEESCDWHKRLSSYPL